MQRRIRRRYTSERNFKLLGMLAILLSAGFLAFLVITMAWNGARGFTRSNVELPFDFPKLAIPLSPAALTGGGDVNSQFGAADLPGAVTRAAQAAFGPNGAATVSDSGWLTLRAAIKNDPSILFRKATLAIPGSPALDVAESGHGDPAMRALYRNLKAKDAVSRDFNLAFLTDSDATDPTQAGIWGAFKGSLLTMLVTLILAFPVGVLSAVYLEEYAPRNRWTDLIEVSINNLAAVPSIIFGLLGLAVFLNTFNLPRSAPLVGGLTLALMTMPVIVIAGRNAIKSVPPSIRDAALGVGSSPIQVVFHHVLPLALPGIMTGTIIGMARALGETAPLLMIGMRAFIATPPSGISDPSSVLPVQIFL